MTDFFHWAISFSMDAFSYSIQYILWYLWVLLLYGAHGKFKWSRSTLVEVMVCRLPLWCHQMEQFPRYWPFVLGINRSTVNSPHKGQWLGALMFSLIWAWTNRWVNNRAAGDLRSHLTHYDVTVISHQAITFTNTKLLSTGRLAINTGEISFKMHTSFFRKMHLNTYVCRWFCDGLNILNRTSALAVPLFTYFVLHGHIKLPYSIYRVVLRCIARSAWCVNTQKCREFSHTLQWRHNERDGVSNHQPRDWLLNNSGTDQRKHQSSAPLVFVRGIHRDLWLPRTNGQ